jgi:hypothetical protein
MAGKLSGGISLDRGELRSDHVSEVGEVALGQEAEGTEPAGTGGSFPPAAEIGKRPGQSDVCVTRIHL